MTEAPPAANSIPTIPAREIHQGLSGAEAARRLAERGANEVAEPARKPLRTFLHHFWAPIPWMLEASILLQGLLGQYVEAAVIFGLLLFNATLYLSAR